jgi:hypothetical protein
VAFTKEGPNGTVNAFDQHTPGVDQVGYMTGVQDLYVQNLITKTEIQTTNPIGQTVTTWEIMIPARDKKPEYRLDLHKYATNNNEPLPGIEFKLYRVSDDALIDTYVTDDDGNFSIEFPPVLDGLYVLRETGGDVPDLYIETRGGAMLINGGPHNYDNIKIIRGGLDSHCYVILDADSSAYVVHPGDPLYPPDLEPVTEEQLGVVHVAISVPNIRYTITEYYHPDKTPFADLQPPDSTSVKPGVSFTGTPPATIADGTNPPWVYIGYKEGDDDSAALIPGSPPAPLVASVDADYDFIYVYRKVDANFSILKTLNQAAEQTERFVYQIEYMGSGASAGAVTRTFYSVLHVQNGQETDIISSAILPEGWYRVTELDNNWRYTLDTTALSGDNSGATVNAAGRWVLRKVEHGDNAVFSFKNDRDDVPWVHGETGVINAMPPIGSHP